MSAGCYYTHDNIVKKAFWIDLRYYYENEEGVHEYDDFLWGDTISNLKYILEDIGYKQESMYKFYNGLYNLTLESGHGDELIFMLEPRGVDQYYVEDIRIFNLAVANHTKCYNKLAKTLIREGHNLSIATSGYTFKTLTI